MNSVCLIGRLGAEPELKHTQSGEAIANLRLAYEQGRDKPTGWVGVSCFGKTAEAVTQYLHKGDECAVEGRLSHREWETDGNKRTVLEIVASRVDFLRRKGEGRGEAPAPAPAPVERTPPTQASIEDADPFGDQ